MSAEAIAFSDTFNNIEESIEERRVRLHRESALIPQALHELETRFNTLTLGLIALGQIGDVHMSEERHLLAQNIAKLRQEQAQLITDIANCNRTIWRPPYDDEWFNKPEKIRNKDERARIEHPYIVQVYNGGEDPLSKDVYNRYLPGIPE